MHLSQLLLHEILIVRVLPVCFMKYVWDIGFSDPNFPVLAIKKDISWALRTFTNHLSNSCWTDDLENALHDLHICDHITFRMLNSTEDYECAYVSLTRYYEWLYSQVRN